MTNFKRPKHFLRINGGIVINIPEWMFKHHGPYKLQFKPENEQDANNMWPYIVNYIETRTVQYNNNGMTQWYTTYTPDQVAYSMGYDIQTFHHQDDSGATWVIKKCERREPTGWGTDYADYINYTTQQLRTQRTYNQLAREQLAQAQAAAARQQDLYMTNPFIGYTTTTGTTFPVQPEPQQAPATQQGFFSRIVSGIFGE